MNKSKRFLVLICLLLIQLGFKFEVLAQTQAQGTMLKENGHYIAALDFFGSYSKETKGSIRRQTNVWSGDGSFLLKGYEDYEKNDIKVSGLVKSAILIVDWWTLFNEPAENYNFQWISSGKYSVEFKNAGDANYQKKWVDRNELSAYPDLLKRFDALQPLDMHFEISWGFDDLAAIYGGNISAYNKIKTQNFTTQIKNGMLFETSGKSPLSVTGIRQGKGHDFLGLPSNYDTNEVSEIFKCMTGENRSDIKIWNFKVIYARWPVEEMKAIAQLYDDYKSGKKEPTPLEQVAEADKENADLNAYNKNDFWGEAFEEENLKISDAMFDPKTKLYSFIIGKVTINNILFKHANDTYFQGVSFTDSDLNTFNQIYKNDVNVHFGHYPLAVVSQSYKRFMTIVKNENNQAEFRMYNFKGDILYLDSEKNNSGYPSYIFLANTPFVLIYWKGGSNNYIYSHYLLNINTMEKIEIPQLNKKSEIDIGLSVFNRSSNIKEISGQNIERVLNENKFVIMIKASPVDLDSKGYDHQLYYITDENKLVKGIFFNK